jgi:hypothetical protein
MDGIDVAQDSYPVADPIYHIFDFEFEVFLAFLDGYGVNPW